MENITEPVRRRRSVRTFDGKEVTDDDREKLALFMEKIENPYGIPASFKFLSRNIIKKAEQIGGRCEIQT